MSSRTIFYFLNYGSSIRNIVSGGVIDRLQAAGYRLVFLGVDERDRCAIEARLHGDFVIEEIGKTPFRGLINRLQRLRTYIWRSRVNYGELLSSHGRAGGLRVYGQYLLGRLLRLVPFSVWAGLNARLARWPNGPALIDKYQPCAAIISNPISEDNAAFEFCRQQGIYSTCVLESWDILTNRGALFSFPDDLLVWNELVAQQAVKYHQFPAERVHVTGIPSFDIYAHPESYPSEAEWRLDNNLPASGPVITYSLSSMHICESEDVVIERLVAARAEGLLPADASILVRFHPSAVAEVAGRYEAMPGVILQYPTKTFMHRKNDETAGTSMTMLAATMYYSSVVVNVFSTLCLEAICCDTPVAVVNFDPEPRPPHRSVKRYLKFLHIKELLEFDAAEVADSLDDLVAGVARSIAHPEARRAQRLACRNAETFGLDGLATTRTAEMLHSLIERNVSEIK